MGDGKTLLVLKTILSMEINELNVNILMSALKTCADFVQMSILRCPHSFTSRYALIWPNPIE